MPLAIRRLVALALVGMSGLALASCGQRADSGEPAIRIDLTPAAVAAPPQARPAAPPLPVPAGPSPPSEAAPLRWTADASAQAAWVAHGEGPPLLSVACERAAGQAPRLMVTRYVPAEPGAEALLALQGNRRILRLPVRAVTGGEWRGVLPMADERVAVFLGGPIIVTLPGGGRLELPDMGAARSAVEGCRNPAPLG